MHPTCPPSHVPHLLVAEDEPAVACIIVESLRDEGYRVTTAADGQHAVEVLPGAEFDLLLTDVRMPRLDGVGLVGHVRQVRPAMPIVVLSGYMTEGDRRTLQGLGVPRGAILEKPLPFPELHDAIRKALRAAAEEKRRERAGGQRGDVPPPG